MKLLSVYIEKLTEQEKAQLRAELNLKNTIQARYILALLRDTQLNTKTFIQTEQITLTTFNKSKTLALDILVTWISENAATNLHAASDVLWWFTSKGLYKEGWQYFLQTEKKLQHNKQYHLLQALYTEAMRLQIYISNIQAMEEIRDHAYSNSIRLLEYTSIQTAYSVEIARLEDATLQPTTVYERKLRALYKQAQRADHHNLVSNVLYCLFVYYTRHDFSLNKAHDTVRDMAKALKRYTTTLTQYGKAVLANNIAQFSMLYNVEQSPEEFIGLVEQGLPPEWQNIGKIGIAGYYISTNQPYKAKALRNTISMKNITIEKEIASVAKLDISLAWEALKKGEITAKEFTKHIRSFYDIRGRRIYRELDFMTRTNEILFLLHQKEYETALAKCESLRKFAERNMHTNLSFFHIIIQPYITTIQALVQGKKTRIKYPNNHTIRWTKWAMDELTEIVNGIAR